MHWKIYDTLKSHQNKTLHCFTSPERENEERFNVVLVLDAFYNTRGSVGSGFVDQLIAVQMEK